MVTFQNPASRAARPVARPTTKAGNPAILSSSLPPVAAQSPVTAWRLVRMTPLNLPDASISEAW